MEQDQILREITVEKLDIGITNRDSKWIESSQRRPQAPENKIWTQLAKGRDA